MKKDKQKKIIAWAILRKKEPLTNQTSLYFDDIIGFSKGFGKAIAQQVAKDMNGFVTNKGGKYTVKKVIINY